MLARRAVARFSTRYSRKWFTPRQHVVSLCLKVKETTTYRDLVDELIEMPRIRGVLDLDSIPAPSTPCKTFDHLETAVWRLVLDVSLADTPPNGVTYRCVRVRVDARLEHGGMRSQPLSVGGCRTWTLPHLVASGNRPPRDNRHRNRE